jgi:hypothetical protein
VDRIGGQLGDIIIAFIVYNRTDRGHFKLPSGVICFLLQSCLMIDIRETSQPFGKPGSRANGSIPRLSLTRMTASFLNSAVYSCFGILNIDSLQSWHRIRLTLKEEISGEAQDLITSGAHTVRDEIRSEQ